MTKLIELIKIFYSKKYTIFVSDTPNGYLEGDLLLCEAEWYDFLSSKKVSKELLLKVVK